MRYVILIINAFFVAGCGSSPPEAKPKQAEAAKPNESAAKRNESAAGKTASKPTANEVVPAKKAANLVVAFQHSPRESVGMLVREDAIPSGWVYGPGRILSPKYYQREIQIAATLTGGKEGEKASIKSFR